MSQFFQIHPQNPQQRLIRQAVEIIRRGGVVAYPTDSCYALGCAIEYKSAQERIRRIRRVDAKHNFTLVCRDLGEIATYARVDNQIYRLLKTLTPGPYTFILRATNEVPRRLQNPRRKTIGIRVPDNVIAQALCEELGQPLMSSTLILPDDDMPMTDPEDMREALEHQVELVIDGGNCGLDPTTVLAFDEGDIEVRRHGVGAVDFLDD